MWHRNIKSFGPIRIFERRLLIPQFQQRVYIDDQEGVAFLQIGTHFRNMK